MCVYLCGYMYVMMSINMSKSSERLRNCVRTLKSISCSLRGGGVSVYRYMLGVICNAQIRYVRLFRVWACFVIHGSQCRFVYVCMCVCACMQRAHASASA